MRGSASEIDRRKNSSISTGRKASDAVRMLCKPVRGLIGCSSGRRMPLQTAPTCVPLVITPILTLILTVGKQTLSGRQPKAAVLVPRRSTSQDEQARRATSALRGMIASSAQGLWRCVAESTVRHLAADNQRRHQAREELRLVSRQPVAMGTSTSWRPLRARSSRLSAQGRSKIAYVKF